jgi:putative ABC transport system ATP-binding protein
MGLEDVRNKYPYQVSGGQVQRACIARALVNQPSIVFADEPTGNLDSKITRNIMEHFEKINRERHITILLVTHDPYSSSFCNRIVFLNDGMIQMEIRRKTERREFFERIQDCLTVLGGEKLDLS